MMNYGVATSKDGMIVNHVKKYINNCITIDNFKNDSEFITKII